MNTPITFPAAAPTLKLARPSTEKWAVTIAEERRRLQEDQEMLREREANLREYEGRLRKLQAEIEALRESSAPLPAPRAGTTAFTRPSSVAPFSEDPALHAAWEKFFRAREIMEAEQCHLRDDRLVVRDRYEEVIKREAAVTLREQQIEERESRPPVPVPTVNTEHPMSAVSRFTRAPFNMARSVFGGTK